MYQTSHIHDEDKKSIIWYKNSDSIVSEEDLDDPNEGLPEEFENNTKEEVEE